MFLKKLVVFFSLRKKAFFPPAKHTKFEEWLLGQCESRLGSQMDHGLSNRGGGLKMTKPHILVGFPPFFCAKC